MAVVATNCDKSCIGQLNCNNSALLIFICRETVVTSLKEVVEIECYLKHYLLFYRKYNIFFLL